MAITNISTDYTGRTKDLFISQNVTGTGSAKVVYNFGKISSYVAGVQKLVQKYIILLINANLVENLEASKGSNVQEATHIFNFANWEALTELRNYQNENPAIPNDEQIASAQLIDLEIAKGELHLTIQLTTMAGENIPFLMPISL